MAGSRVWPVAGTFGALLLAGTVACAGQTDASVSTPPTPAGTEAHGSAPSGRSERGDGQRVRRSPSPDSGRTAAAHRRGDTQTATAAYRCRGAQGRVRLTARPGERPGTVRLSLVTKGFTTPVAVAAGKVRAVLVMSRERADGGTGTAVFRGSTPRLKPGQSIRLGPLRGTVAPGDRLDSYRGKKRTALRLVYGKLRIDCRARSAQRPGPFRF